MGDVVLQPFVPFGPSPERDALCERLEIEPVPLTQPDNPRALGSLAVLGGTIPEGDASMRALEWRFANLAVWAQIGMRLATKQQEFNGGKRSRGRPSLKDKGEPGIDYQRYNYLRNRCREAGEELGKTVTHQAAIERAMDEGVPLFSGELDLLIASVSRGRGVHKDAVRDVRRLWAKGFRTECDRFCERAAWLASVKGDVARMRQLNRMPEGGLLSPVSIERLQLESRLRNPFRTYD